MMRKVSLTALLLLALAPLSSAQDDPAGVVVYSLPQTVISLEVEARREDFHAGPYSKYARKYLGIEVRQEDGVSYEISSVNMMPYVEADQSRRYSVTLGKAYPSFLSLTAQGLISTGEGSGRGSDWKFAYEAKGDFAGKGLNSGFMSEDATLYRNVKNAADNSAAVRQQVVVAKSPETLAKEAADMIFRLRQSRVNIVTGNTDATYSGEAMAAALAEISKLEKEYLSLFTGYSEYDVQKMNFDIIPEKKENGKQLYIAFRLSDSDGLVPADDVSGKPYLLSLEPQEFAAVDAAPVKGNAAWYRIPAVCKVKLLDAGKVLVQSRMPVYQLGIESSFQITK